MLHVFAEGRLKQEPAEEVAALRQNRLLSQSEVLIDEGRSMPLQKSDSPALDISLTLERGEAAASGLLLRAWKREAQEGVPCAEALILDWNKAELRVKPAKFLLYTPS